MYLKVKKLTGIWEKTVGLISQEGISPVYFRTRFGIHTFGVKFPIDVIILDGRDQVVKIKENLSPNSLFFWPPVYNQVIELPTGWVKSHNISTGTKISITTAPTHSPI